MISMQPRSPEISQPDPDMYTSAVQDKLYVTAPMPRTAPDGTTVRLQIEIIWPKSSEHWAARYTTLDGAAVVAQWFADPQKFKRAHQKLQVGTENQLHHTVTAVPAQNLVLQWHGIDDRLPGLAHVAARPGARILQHRPGRRGVVRLPSQTDAAVTEIAPQPNAQPVFVKAVRPTQTEVLADTLRGVQALVDAEYAGRASFSVPQVLDVDSEHGLVFLSALAGSSLLDNYTRPDFARAAHAAGRALAQLHNLTPPSRLAAHDGTAELAVLEKWLARLGTIAPQLTADWRVHIERVGTQLQGVSTAPVLLHRDFYDQQIFIDAGRVGILDFDTLCTGEAALDIANALVHFELRAHMGFCRAAAVRAIQHAFLSSYRPAADTRARIQAYAAATRLRLACVYACRPALAWVRHELLDSLHAPIPAA